MPKNSFQDVVVKKTIRQIPLPKEKAVIIPPRPLPRRESKRDLPEMEKRRSSGPRIIIWSLAVIAVAFLFFAATYVFSSAQVSVVPKQKTLEVNSTFQTAFESGDLPYYTLTAEKSLSSVVSANGEERVEKKASGTIVIYNKTAAAQRLTKNSRFETSDGKIFRLNNSVTVPARILKGNSVTPGSVEAVVSADSAGEEYNIGLSDFTIPGFKGTPKYATIYARSKTPLSGGFLGKRKVASPQDIASARKLLEQQLTSELEQEALTKKTDQFVLFKNALQYEFTEEPVNASSESVVVAEKGVARAILFKGQDLLSKIAKEAAFEYTGQIDSPNLESLAFEIKKPKSGALESTSTPLTVALSGIVSLIAHVDVQNLRTSLEGQSKGNLTSVAGRFPAIQKMDVVLHPFWRSSFPSMSKIHVSIGTSSLPAEK